MGWGRVRGFLLFPWLLWRFPHTGYFPVWRSLLPSKAVFSFLSHFLGSLSLCLLNPSCQGGRNVFITEGPGSCTIPRDDSTCYGFYENKPSWKHPILTQLTQYMRKKWRWQKSVLISYQWQRRWPKDAGLPRHHNTCQNQGLMWKICLIVF